MSRSRKKTPIHGNTCAESEKNDKRIWHRQFRRLARICLRQGCEIMPHFREVSDTWCMAKDGRNYFLKTPKDFPRWQFLMK